MGTCSLVNNPIRKTQRSIMHISNFDDLLTAARNQSTAQRLLFVFTAIELPADSTEQQRADFAAGRGGAFTPLMCVDRSPQEVHSFTELCREATQFDQPWRMVFAASEYDDACGREFCVYVTSNIGAFCKNRDVDCLFDVTL